MHEQTASVLPKLLLSPREAACAMSLSARTLWSITSPRGDLPCVKCGRCVRYDPRDLLAWAEKRKQRTP